MQRCEQILADLEDAMEEHAAVRPWRLYLNGILFAERDHDWASAERTYVTLLSEEAIEPQLQIRTLLALGIAHHYQGKWPEAIHAFTCSLPIAEAEGESISKIKALNEISATYQQGFIYGDYDKMALQDALDYGTQALKLLATLDSEQVNQLEGILLNNLGLIHKSLGNWDRAIQCYKRDLALSEIQDNRYGMGLSYGNLAEVWHEMGPDSWPLAQNAYQNALDLIREAGNLYEEIEALTNLATLYLDMDDSATAIEHFESAIALVESLRARTTSADSRTGFFSTVVKTYAGAVDAYLAADQPMDAFNVAERSRSRTLIEMLAEQPTRTTRHVPVSLLTEEQRIREHLRTLVNQSEPDKTDIAQVEEQWDDLQHKVQLVSAEYAAFQEFYPLTLQEIQRRLPSDTALIAYFTSATRIVALVITYASFTVVPLALKPDVLGLAFDDQGYIHRLLPASDGRLLEP
ncbi:MAG: tetratricopeptide repeat protein, partial [Caldilineaceae bacterium]|nr:tetratricopeptide repeat protein [Caldilineaceae bacterium]